MKVEGPQFFLKSHKCFIISIMINITMNTIESEVLVEQSISKSRFLSYLAPISNEEEAKEYLRRIKKEHPKATHHCSAFVVGDIERSNDDGEPASSAGLPMLQVLRGQNLTGVIAVVVRYFGGIKLGVGGLIRAYGSSVTLAIEHAVIMSPQSVTTVRVQFPYAYTNEVETHLASICEVLDRAYESEAIYTVDIKDPSLLEVLNDYTRGTCTIETVSQRIDYVRREHDDQS